MLMLKKGEFKLIFTIKITGGSFITPPRLALLDFTVNPVYLLSPSGGRRAMKLLSGSNRPMGMPPPILIICPVM
jgi:hypothetical protein